MPYDVFISHSTDDKLVALALCNKLESAGVRCWIAPRDVGPGEEWGKAIVDAITGCPLMVLVFSSKANQSRHIHREVQTAFEKDSIVIPFRVENTQPTGTMEYYLGSVHWLDALTQPVEEHLQALVERVKTLLLPTAAQPVPSPVPQSAAREAADSRPVEIKTPPFQALHPPPGKAAAGISLPPEGTRAAAQLSGTRCATQKASRASGLNISVTFVSIGLFLLWRYGALYSMGHPGFLASTTAGLSISAFVIVGYLVFAAVISRTRWRGVSHTPITLAGVTSLVLLAILNYGVFPSSYYNYHARDWRLYSVDKTQIGLSLLLILGYGVFVWIKTRRRSAF